jgi:flagellar biosynthesis regulator FlbT
MDDRKIYEGEALEQMINSDGGVLIKEWMDNRMQAIANTFINKSEFKDMSEVAKLQGEAKAYKALMAYINDAIKKKNEALRSDFLQ